MRCRETTLDDYEQIHALERRYNLGFRSYEEWSHLWVNNPVCARVPTLPIGWVLEDDRGQIIGSIGSVPFDFELDGRQLIAGTSSAWVVDERYRAYAPLLLDRFLTQPGVDIHLGVSPNGEAQAAVALHSERIPTGRWDQAAFWITDYWRFAGSALAKRRIPFRSVLRVPVWAAMIVHRAFRGDTLRAARRTAAHDVVISTEFDERFDEFWQRLRANSRGRLLATRSRDVLEWHFRYPLRRGAAWVSSVGADGRLLAYAIFCRKDVTGIDLRRVRLVDFQSLDGDTGLLLPILADAIDRCRRGGTSVLESIGWRLDPGDVMDRLAPYRRPLPSWQYFYTVTDPDLATTLRQRDVWNPSQYDGDACI